MEMGTIGIDLKVLRASAYSRVGASESALRPPLAPESDFNPRNSLRDSYPFQDERID